MAGDVAVLGATASGKTALAVELARRRHGLELASIDAFACYRRLDIGTAKPDASERDGVSWHLIDIVEPNEELSIAAFATFAKAATDAIHARGQPVCYVGGSGLYLRSVLDDLTPPPRYTEIAATLEERVETEGLDALYRELAALDAVAASRMEPTNRRRIVRALEVTLGSGAPFSSFGPGMEVYPDIDCTLVGLAFERAELDRRIVLRLAAQLEAGFFSEVRALLADDVQLSRTATQAIGYRELAEVVNKTMTLEAATAEILRRSRNLARRQLAWLRRDPRITWVDGARPDLVDHVAEFVWPRFTPPNKNVRGPNDLV